MPSTFYKKIRGEERKEKKIHFFLRRPLIRVRRGTRRASSKRRGACSVQDPTDVHISAQVCYLCTRLLPLHTSSISAHIRTALRISASRVICIPRGLSASSCIYYQIYVCIYRERDRHQCRHAGTQAGAQARGQERQIPR